MDILYDMAVSKLSAIFLLLLFFKVNYSSNSVCESWENRDL